MSHTLQAGGAAEPARNTAGPESPGTHGSKTGKTG